MGQSITLLCLLFFLLDNFLYHNFKKFPDAKYPVNSSMFVSFRKCQTSVQLQSIYCLLENAKPPVPVVRGDEDKNRNHVGIF
jgi:hypothetical protein